MRRAISFAATRLNLRGRHVLAWRKVPEHRQDEASCPRRLAREYYAERMEMRRRALAAEEECREAEREISELMAAKEREEAEARRHWRCRSPRRPVRPVASRRPAA